jgi:NAD+ diphosphatase
MMGFVARYAGGEPVARDGELEDVRWFGREEVAAAATEHGWSDGDPGSGLLLPPRTAIARRLIEDWLRA